ncbi:Hypothetical protein POVN_LOCUS287 [uncultured virus]|nr:Hypothetical protein POVN_LOCUS287 [uncultured virus]
MEHKIDEDDVVREVARLKADSGIIPENSQISIDSCATAYVINVYNILAARMDKLLVHIRNKGDLGAILDENSEDFEERNEFSSELYEALKELDRGIDPSSSASAVTGLIIDRIDNVIQANPTDYLEVTKGGLLDMVYTALLHILLITVVEAVFTYNRRRDYIPDAVTVTCFYVSYGLTDHVGFANVLRDLLPPAPLCGVSVMDEDIGGWITEGQVREDLQRAFPKLPMEEGVDVVCRLVVVYILGIFQGRGDELLEAWLDSLPIKDESSDLEMQCYRKVMGLIVAGIRVQPATELLSYNLVVYAVLQNPYYDLTSYLHAQEVE